MRVLSVAVFCIVTICVLADDSSINTDDLPFRGTRIVEFDWKLIKKVLASQESNVVISPFSVKIMLVLLYEATGQGDSPTHTEIKSILRLVLDPKGGLTATRTNYRQWLDSALASHKDYAMRIDTKFFVEEYIDIISKFQTIAEYFYDTSDQNVPFSNPQLAADMIDNWVNTTTSGRISALVTANEVENAVIVLLSVVCFKGLWTYPFSDSGTTLTFHGTKNQIQTEFMQQSGALYYDDSASLGAQLLRLPYRGGKFAMYILLPHEGKTIDDVLEKVTPSTLHQALWYMDETVVNVTIPKFKFDFAEELIQPLKDIGLAELFSDNASFPLLARGKGARNAVRPSRMFQKVAISINEVGSEAIASSEVQLVNKIGGDEAQSFNANRPFLFFIEDEDFGTLHFAGKVEDPSK